MTQPTQAQKIEAAAKAMDKMLRQGEQCETTDLAKAALTAAERVEAKPETFTQSWNSGSIPFNATKVNITGQITGQTRAQLIAATIEECAKVAESFPYTGDPQSILGSRSRSIAAAIRAMKDKIK